MNKQKYNLITVSIEALVKDEKNTINYMNARECRKYIISEEQQDDCALFYQLQMVLKNIPDANGFFDSDSLKEVIFFADFGSIFDVIERGKSSTNSSVIKKARAYEALLQGIFDDGISVSFSSKKIQIFMPFDKSNSMSRACKMTFLGQDYVEEVNTRLLLGVDFYSMKNVKLSKYYAYKGLYLSSATRMNPEALGLNEEKLVVVEDSHIPTESDVALCTGKEEDGLWKLKDPDSKKHYIKKLFDGEGLISRTFYKKLNADNSTEKATSFQVRMPFIKGMLHYVDFHRFLCEYASLKNGAYIIKDAFGKERDLMKADIIIPISMFKCYEWLGQYASIKNAKDAMKIYFDGYSKYGHSLYIANTNLNMGKSCLTTLNYQFINTLKVSNESFSRLVEEHLEYVRNPHDYINNVTDINHNGEFSRDVSSWQLVLNKNADFVHERKINGQLKSISESLRKDIGTGHLVTKGTVCYLSRDLIFFLLNLLTLSIEKEESISDIVKEHFATEYLMPCDYFYLPNSNLDYRDERKYGFKSDCHYPIFRNPHLSRNEQCALRFFTPSNKSIYKKYLGHLKGVCMVGYSSVDPLALGGADFDGDLVKIFVSSDIRNAVLGGAYEKKTISDDERHAVLNDDNERAHVNEVIRRSVLKGEEYYYRRKLPIIDIPSPSIKEATSKPSDKIDYEVIRKTFSNKIGQISNLAVRLGQIEYNDKATAEQKKALGAHCCAECTLLTGLEIDAAKTGIHPDLSHILESSDAIREELKYDYISDFKEIIDQLCADKIHFTSNNLTTDGTDYGYRRFKKDKKNSVSYIYDASFSAVNLLPKFFFDCMNVQMVDRSISSKIIYFDFMQVDNWSRTIDEKLQEKIAAIIKAYNQVLYIDRKIRAVKNYYGSGSFEAYTKNILRLQYDDSSDFEDAIIDLLNEFDGLHGDTSAFKEEIMALKSDTTYINWFCAYSEKTKEKTLKAILKNDKIDVNKYRFLYNYGAHGYLMLFFLLSDAMGIKVMETENSILFDELYGDNEKNLIHTVFYDQLVDKYKGLSKRKILHWRKVILDLCKEEIDEIMKSNSLSRDDIMPILYSLTTSNQVDSSGNFFWHYFTADELLNHVYDEFEKEHE